jgi:hypothetical protein
VTRAGWSQSGWWRSEMSRRELATFVTWLISLVVAVACVVWAVAVQFLVPNACTYAVPPPNAQYLHCR